MTSPTAVNSQDARVAEFRRLHEAGCFVMPNPWDRGSARLLEQQGFPALATTSSGLAWTLGKGDGEVTLDEALTHLEAVAGAVAVPVNADFEGGYAVEPAAVAANVRRAVSTGVAGLSIEDASADPEDPLLSFDLSVERVAAARQAIDDSGTGVLLTARTEGFIVGRPDLDETLHRLTAYADAGADCLYAPGIRTSDEIAAVVSAVAPEPVNLLVHQPFITVAEAAALGVRRISTGGALARTAWAGLLAACDDISDTGGFGCFADLPSVDDRLRGH